MNIAKWEKIDLKELLRIAEKKEMEQLLVYNHVTDRWLILSAIDICRAFANKVSDGLWDVYKVRYVGKEMYTDDVDFQDELDKIDDGIYNYGEE